MIGMEFVPMAFFLRKINNKAIRPVTLIQDGLGQANFVAERLK